jgi:hypothetical protein
MYQYIVNTVYPAYECSVKVSRMTSPLWKQQTKDEPMQPHAVKSEKHMLCA